MFNAEVRAEKVVVLGLEMPISVKVEETGNVLTWEYVPGVAAGEWDEGVASVLTIKDRKALIGKERSIGVDGNIFYIVNVGATYYKHV